MLDLLFQPTEVDLKGEDRVLIRDGDMVFHNLLAEMTSTSGATPRYVLSTGRHLYITMQTRGLETGRGFRFSYWQGGHAMHAVCVWRGKNEGVWGWAEEYDPPLLA